MTASEQAMVLAFALCSILPFAYLATCFLGVAAPTRGASLICCAAPFVAGAWFYFRFTNDDAFIFFRYARNLLEGEGLVYNAGQRVEGFTSPAWVLLSAAAGWLTGDVALASKAMGIVLALGAIGVFLGASVRMLGPTLGLLSTLVLSTSQLLLAWAGSGMDVAVFILFECLMVDLFVGGRSRSWALAVTAAGVWIRPEAYLFLGVYWLGLILQWSGERRLLERAPLLAAAAVLAALPIALRWAYYGALVPNTYVAKSFLTLQDGWLYVQDLAVYLGAPLLVLAAIGALRALRSEPWLIVCGLGSFAYLIAVGGDILSLRLGLFALPWICLAAGTAFRDIPAAFAVGVAVALTALSAAASVLEMKAAPAVFDSQVGPLYVINNSRGTLESDYLAGSYLADHASPTDVLVADNIGAVGYLSRLPVRDTYGLVTPDVAAALAAGRFADVGPLVLPEPQPWILCYFTATPDGQERWVLWNVGDITGWARGRYDAVKRWTTTTGYQRVLLRRRDPPRAGS